MVATTLHIILHCDYVRNDGRDDGMSEADALPAVPVASVVP